MCWAFRVRNINLRVDIRSWRSAISGRKAHHRTGSSIFRSSKIIHVQAARSGDSDRPDVVAVIYTAGNVNAERRERAYCAKVAGNTIQENFASHTRSINTYLDNRTGLQRDVCTVCVLSG